MSMPDPDSQSTALAQLRGDMMTLLTRIEGDVRLVLQQQEQAGRRAEDQDRKIERLDERQDRLESAAATKAELRAEITALKAAQDERARRNIALASLAMTGAGVISGAGVGIVTALIK